MKQIREFVLAAAVALFTVGWIGTATAAAEEFPVPNVKYDTLVEAESALEEAGFPVSVMPPTVDTYCNNLNDVLVQTPAAGTFFTRGMAVKLSLGAPPAAGCPVRRKFLFLNVGWLGENDVPAEPLFPSAETFKYLHGTVNQWFNDASLGKFPGFDIQDGGSYLIQTPEFDNGVCGSGFNSDLFASAKFAASSAGYDLLKYDGVLIYFRKGICDGGSQEVLGSTWRGVGIWVSGRGTSPIPAGIIHEFGHVLGLGHSGIADCTNSSGFPVTLSNTCTYSETTDLYSAMGQGSNFLTGEADVFTASHLNQLGWLNGRSATVQAQDGVSWQAVLKPIGEASEGLHAIKLQDGPTLWLEYRKPVGLDKGGYGWEPGLVIHQELSVGGNSAFLIDLQPVTALKADLPVGQTWANPLGVMKVTLNSVDSQGAHITISSQFVTVPDISFNSMEEARRKIENAGLVWGGTTNVLVTDCGLVGAILDSSPSGGTRQPAGTVVKADVGVLDPKRRCL